MNPNKEGIWDENLASVSSSRWSWVADTARDSVDSVMSWLRTKEVAGKKILAIPLELIGMTSLQEEAYLNAGWLIDPDLERSMKSPRRDHPSLVGSTIPSDQLYDSDELSRMMTWKVSLEDYLVEIEDRWYRGFALFQKIFEGFPEFAAMTESQARDAGVYPYLYFRNHFAREWWAKMNGGHIATPSNSEIQQIIDWMTGNTFSERLASVGIAPVGAFHHWRAQWVWNLASIASEAYFWKEAPEGKTKIYLSSSRDLGDTHDAYDYVSVRFGLSSIIVFDK